jgi:hypothetical protein
MFLIDNFILIVLVSVLDLYLILSLALVPIETIRESDED